MPALSQNLTFTVNNTSSVSVNYPNTATEALTYISDRVKGDGYYGNSDGFHTTQIQTTDFVGKIEIQGTLAVDPTNTDWFNVSLSNNYTTSTFHVSYTTATSAVLGYNFIGNIVWVRSKISEFTQGSVNFVRYNH